MNRLLIGAAAAALLFAAAHPASADQTLASKGYWRTFSTASNDRKVTICGMDTTMSKKVGNVYGALMVKAQTDTDGLWVQFVKTNWKFPADGRSVDVPLNF